MAPVPTKTIPVHGVVGLDVVREIITLNGENVGLWSEDGSAKGVDLTEVKSVGRENVVSKHWPWKATEWRLSKMTSNCLRTARGSCCSLSITSCSLLWQIRQAWSFGWVDSLAHS